MFVISGIPSLVMIAGLINQAILCKRRRNEEKARLYKSK
jgi:hypothetical protein